MKGVYLEVYIFLFEALVQHFPQTCMFRVCFSKKVYIMTKKPRGIEKMAGKVWLLRSENYQKSNADINQFQNKSESRVFIC